MFGAGQGLMNGLAKNISTIATEPGIMYLMLIRLAMVIVIGPELFLPATKIRVKIGLNLRMFFLIRMGRWQDSN